MAKLRPGHHAFLLQVDACILIESPLRDPIDALDHYLNDPASKSINIQFSDAVSNRSTHRRVRLSPAFPASQNHPQQNPIDKSDPQADHRPSNVPATKNKVIRLDHYRHRQNSPA